MVKIQDLVEEFKISKEELNTVSENVLGKKIGTTITQKQYDSIKSYFQKDTTSESKVLKGGELDSGDSFLSGLGFAQEEKKVVEETIITPEIKQAKPIEKEIKVDEPKREELRVARVVGHIPQPQKVQPTNPKPTQTQGTKTPTSQPIKNNRASTNVQFSQGVAKEEKPYVNKPSFESALLAHNAQIAKNASEQKNTPRTNQPQQSGGEKTGIRYFNQQTNKPNFARGKQGTPTKAIPKAPIEKVEKEQKTSSTLIKKTEIILGQSISVKEFAEKMGVPLGELIKKLLGNKIIASVNSMIDIDTASLIAMDFDIIVKREIGSMETQDIIEGDLGKILEQDKDSDNLLQRAPIVTVMGHVDHGKTSLLDYIRKTVVASGEVGGITQSIGASSIERKGKKIIFIDTPGHELFSAIRARGAKITNIAIIVIAADDGVMPTTIEAINHAKEAGVKIIVAITKIDKGDKNVERIRTQIMEHGLVPLDRGGDVPMIGVSSHTGQGVEELLDTILATAEELDLQYNPQRDAVGVVLESHRDNKQGVLTSMIIMSGTIKIGDILVIKDTYGKIRRIQDWLGNDIKVAKGGEPVNILGISDVSEPGRIGQVVKNEKIANQMVNDIKIITRKEHTYNPLQAILSKVSQGEETQLKLIIKADMWGSLEALKTALETMPTPENLSIKVVHSDVGAFTESDLSLAQASKSILLGFGVSINSNLKKKADQMHTQIKAFDIIYEIIDYINLILTGMIVIEEREEVIGKLEVLGVFFRKDKDMIIGGKVLEGKIKNGVNFRLLHGEDIIGTGKVQSLRKGDDNVDEISQGHECGMKVRVSKKIEERDILEFYEIV